MIWIVFAAMIGIALLVLLRPLLAAPKAATPRGEYDMVVYKDQLGEITRDVERGLLTQSQAEAARTEVSRRMLAASEEAKPAAAKSGRAAAIAVVIAIPLVSLPLYLMLGAPELPDRPYSSRVGQLNEMKERAATIQGMVTRLADRLKQDPSDGKGWGMLGRSYRALGRVDEAKDAYRKAIALLPKDVQPRIELGVLLLDEAQGNTMPAEASTLFAQALALSPDQPDALYFTGLDAAMKGDKATAKQRWTRLQTLLPADSPAHAEVQKALDQLGSAK